MNIANPSAEKVEILFPDTILFTDEIISKMNVLNPDFSISSNGSKNGLILKETNNRFSDFEWIELKLLEGFELSEDFMFEMNSINEGEISSLEFEENGKVIIKMSIFAIIGLITGVVFASLYNWAKSRKNGRVYTEDTGYKFISSTGKVSHREADVSYIDFNKASEVEQKSWNGYIPIAPTLAIEIISAKHGLKPAMNKMEKIWIKNGADIGLIICPFSKQIYIYEKGKSGCCTQSIYEPFTHELLPGYVGDFSEYVDEIK